MADENPKDGASTKPKVLKSNETLLFSDSSIDYKDHAPPKSKNIDGVIRAFSEKDEVEEPLRNISYDDKYGFIILNM